MADQRDEGDESDWASPVVEPVLPTDDYQRHLRAEARWQGFLAARRLWERVKRCIALGR